MFTAAFRKILRYFRIEEVLAFLLFVIVMCINIFMYDAVSFSETLRTMLRYFLFGNEFLFMFGVVLFVYFIFIASRRMGSDLVGVFVDGNRLTTSSVVVFFKTMLTPARILVPVALVSVSFFQLLKNIGDNTFEFYDKLFYFADVALIGNIIENIKAYFQSDLSANILFGFYISLPILMGLALIAGFFRNKRIFKITIISLIMTQPFSFPFYFIMPCQDPSNAFIYNGAQENAEIIVSSFTPGSVAQENLDTIHASEVNKHKPVAPVSCFPSMHAAWAYMSIIFLGMIQMSTLVLTIPWVLVMLTGGLYYGQHYFIDYLFSIPITILCIVSAYILVKFENRFIASDSNESAHQDSNLGPTA